MNLTHEGEQWRPVDQFPGYDVSDQGRVRSTSRTVPRGLHSVRLGEQILMGCKRFSANGRPAKVTVSLRRDGHSYYVPVHRLMLIAFVGPCPPGLECCHYDGDPFNNDLRNLRWDTHQSNCADSIRHGTYIAPPVHHGESHHNATISDSDVAMMRSIPVARGTQVALAQQFSVSPQTICRILSGRSR
jgi:hypothetical protein